MATDQASRVPAIAHALQAAEGAFGRKADMLVDLGATSPLRDRFMDDLQVFNPDTPLFEMPGELSVDIDSPLVFKFVEMLLIQKNFG